VRDRSRPARAAWWAAALIPLLFGFLLRIHYLFRAEPFVDEPTTVLAAQAIANTGFPVLPSGLFYGNDLVFTYLVGLLVRAAGADLTLIRAFSLVVSLVSIALAYTVGWHVFDRSSGPSEARARGPAAPWIGFWAASLLALSPAAVIWGARARAYALLQLLVLLSVWLVYLGVKSDRDGPRRLGWVLLVVAVYVHPEAGLLLPAMFAGVVLVNGWRWWLRPGRAVELVLATVAISSRFWWQTVLASGWIGGLATPTGSRPPLELVRDLPARLSSVAPFFLEGGGLLWTSLALLALASAVWAVLGGKRRESQHAILFFSACLWSVPLAMVLFLGSTYQSPRYLSMILPLFALLAASGLQIAVAGVAQLLARSRSRVWLAGLASCLLVAISLPGAVAASSSQEKAFRSAFEYVGAHWQPGDRIATVAPAYAKVILGQSDYFILGSDYEEFVYQDNDGALHDRWLGTPLIRSSQELVRLLEGSDRVWVVTDEGRLRTRFSPDFAQTLWQRMELVANVGGVFVFESFEPSEPAVSNSVNIVFGDKIVLSGYDLGLGPQAPADPGWGDVVVQPGQPLPLTLRWSAADQISTNYAVFVHLLGADGHRYTQADGPPLAGIQPMTHWQQGEVLPDRRLLELPPDLPQGRYRLELGLYEPESGDRLPVSGSRCGMSADAISLDYVRVLPSGEGLPSAGNEAGSELRGDGDAFRLEGHTLPTRVANPGDALPLSLTWQALAPVKGDYTVFVHLIDAQDGIWGQGDGPPLDGFYPTCLWDPGELVVDQHQLNIAPDTPAGTYRLTVGLYLLSSGERLLTEGGDRLIIDEIEIRP
jgi:4-amino-4-deoxy-L-arabinose transferase-like glycosyltransferase